MFWLIYVTVNIIMSSYSSSADTASLVNGIVNNAVFHSISHINHMLPQIIHILRFFMV